MSAIIATIKREPVMVAAMVRTGLLMLLGFGLKLSIDQLALVMTFIETGLTLAARSAVTPMATLPDIVAAEVLKASNASVQPKIPINLSAERPL